MKLELEFEPAQGYMRICAQGIRDESTLLELARQTVQKCTQHGLTRAIADVRQLVGGVSTFESHSMASRSLLDLTSPETAPKVAVLDLLENRIRFEFFEEVVTKRGLALRFFTEEASALAWLETDDTTPSRK
ncbi:MAG: hypothetical protein GY906_21180 [bacterium]|nr:hypothetical protein [bacterium]